MFGMNQGPINSIQIMNILNQNQNMKAMISTLIQNPHMMQPMNNILNTLIYNPTIMDELKYMLNFENMNKMNTMNMQETFQILFRKQGLIIAISCKPSDKFADVIEKYRNKSLDNDKDNKFIFNSHVLDPRLTVEELRISNNNYIEVVGATIIG